MIIDYAYNDEIPGYQEHPDALAGRNGLRIRDEIRMIRPGFYLGRAYANKIFLLNFILYNSDVADAGLDGFAARRRGRRGLLARRAGTAGRPQMNLAVALAGGRRGARRARRRRARPATGPDLGPDAPPAGRSLLDELFPAGLPTPSRPSSTGCAPSPAPRTSPPP